MPVEHENLQDLVDIGANLSHDSFAHDLEQVLARARQHGVSHIIVTGSDDASNRHAQDLVQKYPHMLSATAGLHPHHAKDYNEDLDQSIRRLARNDLICAIGETGLDYNRNYSPRSDQIQAFEKQLGIATELELPVFLHQRDAHNDFLALLKQFRAQLAAVVVHCFTDTRKALHDYLDLDCHIGITGWVCDERRGQHLHALLPDIPSNRLMIESDAPYLLPRDLQPKPADRRNEPMHLAHICRAVARHRHEPAALTGAHCSRNSRDFFRLSGLSLNQDMDKN